MNFPVNWEEIELSEGTQSILKELETLFGSIISVPVPLLLTGVCFLMSEKCLSGLQEILEEFLSSWNYVEQKSCYILRTVDKQQLSFEGHICSSLPVEKYVEVTKVYVVSLLGVVLDNYELANVQLTKADLPEEERQALLEQLQCACVRTNSNSNSLLDLEKPQSVGRSDLAVSNTNTSPCEDRCTRTIETISHDVKLEGARSPYPGLGSLFKAFRSFFLFFRAITLKLGSAHLVISHGRVMLVGAFTFAVLYIVQKKGDTFKRFAARQISGIKNAVLDAWRLAFSMQVNPLAAIQPPLVVTHGQR
ncbi:protein APEM9 isoform X3 [Nymphaea colorata]|uniref:protein APEM9 isoform X3 n=1 Tax=Nymphaea colorata TaxID=210225 RepID=UPI00129E60FE|nr:protein APEM9 isoform X3 [Nymphaea colorata]